MFETISQGHRALEGYLILSAVIFSAGLFAAVARRNGIAMLVGALLMLNAAALNLAAVGRFQAREGAEGGCVFALLAVVLAAAQSVALLSLVLAACRTHRTADVSEMDDLHW